MKFQGGVAQLAEHMVCNHGVRGSSPLTSTRLDVTKLAPRANLDTKRSLRYIQKVRLITKKAAIELKVLVFFDNRIGKIPNNRFLLNASDLSKDKLKR